MIRPCPKEGSAYQYPDLERQFCSNPKCEVLQICCGHAMGLQQSGSRASEAPWPLQTCQIWNSLTLQWNHHSQQRNTKERSRLPFFCLLLFFQYGFNVTVTYFDEFKTHWLAPVAVQGTVAFSAVCWVSTSGSTEKLPVGAWLEGRQAMAK